MGLPAVCIVDGGPEVYAHNAAKERFPVKDTWQMPQLTLMVALAAVGVCGVQESILE